MADKLYDGAGVKPDSRLCRKCEYRIPTGCHMCASCSLTHKKFIYTQGKGFCPVVAEILKGDNNEREITIRVV